MMKRILLAIFGFALGFSTLFAQTEEKEKKSQFTATMSSITNSVWEGRSDSIVTPSFLTAVGYHFKFGAYINGGLNFIPNRQINILDLATIEAGYEFPIIKDVFVGNVSYTKNFYSQYSTQVGSEIDGAFTAEFSYDFNLVQLAMRAAYSYGVQNDVGVTSALSKNIEIEIAKEHMLSLNPTVTVFAGTQNLYAIYLITRSQKATHGKNSHAAKASSNAKKNPHAINNTTTTTIVTTTVTQNVQYSKFNMLDVDISLPISYVYKKFTFGVTPTLSLPLNVQAGEFTSRPFFVSFSVAFTL